EVESRARGGPGRGADGEVRGEVSAHAEEGNEDVAGPNRDVGGVGGRLGPAGRRRLPDAVGAGGEVEECIVSIKAGGRGGEDAAVNGVEQRDGLAGKAGLGAVLDTVPVDVVEDLAVDGPRVADADDAFDVITVGRGVRVARVEREDAGVGA